MATIPSIGFIGERLDLKIKQGGTFGPVQATMVNPNATPVNLTGATIRGQIRKLALDTVIVETFNVVITNPTAGQYTFGLTDEETALIPAGELLDVPDSLYVWDMELEDAGGSVQPLYWGEVKVWREVTR